MDDEWGMTGTGYRVGKFSKIRLQSLLHNPVNMLKNNELHTLNGELYDMWIHMLKAFKKFKKMSFQ